MSYCRQRTCLIDYCIFINSTIFCVWRQYRVEMVSFCFSLFLKSKCSVFSEEVWKTLTYSFFYPKYVKPSNVLFEGGERKHFTSNMDGCRKNIYSKSSFQKRKMYTVPTPVAVKDGYLWTSCLPTLGLLHYVYDDVVPISNFIAKCVVHFFVPLATQRLFLFSLVFERTFVNYFVWIGTERSTSFDSLTYAGGMYWVVCSFTTVMETTKLLYSIKSLKDVHIES